MKNGKLTAMKWMATGMILGTGFLGLQNLQKTKVSSNPIDWMIPDAEARKFLNPATISFSTAAGRGDFIRFLYFMVNGAPSGLGYTFPGPDGGFVGMIQQMTNKLGAALGRAGYLTCEDIPTTGSASQTITKEGVPMTMRMAFGPGTRTIPNPYSGYGALFSKRVSVFRGDDQVMAFEMTCENGSGVRTGYILADKDMMKESGREVKRGMEIYFQKSTLNNAGRVDMLQVAEGSASNGEKLAVTFSVDSDGDAFQLWVIRTTSSGGDSFGVRGSRASNEARLSSIRYTGTGTNNVMMIQSVDGTAPNTFTECLNFSGVNATSAGTGCASINARSGDAVFGTSTTGLTWTISDVSSATITDLQAP
jgi:hypothetical protein